MLIPQHFTQAVDEFPMPRGDIFPRRVQDMDLDQTNAEIELLEARLRPLKTRRNQLTLTGQISDDVLLLIFALSQREGASGKRPYAWMTLGAVCQRWRRLLVGTPTLWTYIEPSAASSNFIDILLERSRECLLDISVHSLIPAEFTQQLLRRARTLSMPGRLLKAGGHLEAPAPFLEELIVKKLGRYITSGGTEARAEVIEPFFGGFAPKLRRVHFVAHPTRMGSWAGLLIHVQYANLVLGSWEGLIPAISSMAAVKELVLRLPLRINPAFHEGDGYSSTSRHHIPTLSTLALCGMTSSCSAFLSHFIVPRSARLTFRIISENSLGSEQLPGSELFGRSIFECRGGAFSGENDIQTMALTGPLPEFEIRLWNNLLGKRRKADPPNVLVDIRLFRKRDLGVWLTGWLRCADLWTLKEVEVGAKDRELLEALFPLAKALEPFECVAVVNS